MIAALPSPLIAWLDIPTGWLLVGAALALATIMLVSLLRTTWRYAKPWKKCALLSFWVHILLAYVATVVQIASSSLGLGPGQGPGFGPSPPIQVALLSAAEITPLSAPDEAVEVEAAEADAASDVVEAKEPTEATPAEPLEAPDLIAQPEPPPAPEAEPSAEAIENVAANDEPQEEPEVADPTETSDVVSTESQSEKELQPPSLTLPAEGREPEKAPAEAAANSPKPASAVQSPTTGVAATAVHAAPPPAQYTSRFAANREQLVAGGGGNADTERAVQAALGWLAAAQSEDGRWDAKRHGAGQERYVLGQNRGGAGAKADTGVSGLALLAFLAAGHTHRDGPHTAEVAKGLDFLRRSQRSTGNLSGDAELFAQTYCHSMATFAASEAYALTHDERLAPMVRAAAGYSLAMQHPTDGGWRYQYGQAGDTSQLGWQVMALRSAEAGAIDIPQVTWTRVERFLRSVERGASGGLAVYRPDEARPTRSMTAEALFCRQLATGRADGGLTPAGLHEALASLLQQPPAASEINLYYWYYATLALHRAQHASPEAAEAWRRWNDSLTRTLLSTQREDGAWPETCLWGGYGGRVFTTSLAAMCLEVYYRYAPTNDAAATSDIAQRPAWRD